MKCPRCHAEAPAASLFCGSCGAPLSVVPSSGDEDGVTLFPSRGEVLDVVSPGRRLQVRDEEAGLTVLPTPPGTTGPLHHPTPAGGGDGTPNGVAEAVTGLRATSMQPSLLNREDEGDAASTIAPSTRSTRAGTDTGPLSPGQAFGRRYRIIKLLGLGGMGAVYQAWDAELSVVVALKVIRPEAAADDPTAARELERRFKRELLLARQVTHKNVVRIHDLGELHGIKYITMPFLEGEDLASILKREGRLGVSRTLTIARGILSGLAAAHQAGVVHRDLKPANIMVGNGDEPLIMDFGIARSTGDAAAAGKRGSFPEGAALAAGVTTAGEIVGTVEYMAPEQARGEPADQRADIYAIGLILYDMLLGRRRHQHAASAIAELRERLESTPPSPRSVDEQIPDSLDRIITRCLAPDPRDRYQSTQALVAELDGLDAEGQPLPGPRRLVHRVVAVSVLLVVAMFGINWWIAKSRPPVATVAQDPVTVLIADFSNDTGDPAFDHTLEPMLRLGLEGAGFINAYDRTRVRAAFGIRPPEKLDEAAARQVAMKQGVRMVLSGSISASNGGYQIAVKATQPISGNVTSTATARAPSKDRVLPTVTKLAAAVRKALGEKASEADQLFAMRAISQGSLDAVSHYAAGIQLQSKGQYEEAIAKFRKAVAIDPMFGPGYNSLAVNLRNVGKVEESNRFAREALRRLDSMTERERLSTRGNYYRLSGDLQQCVKEYGELLTRYPADTVARNNRAFCLARLRDYRQATSEMRQALKILPNHMTYRGNLALWAGFSGDFASAEGEVGAISQPTADAMQALPLSLLAQGRSDAAAETYRKMSTMGSFGVSFAASGLGDLAVYEGRYSDAVSIYRAGVDADIKAENPEVAAQKLVAMAHAQLQRGQQKAAIAAAREALSHSQAVSVQFLAGRVLVEAGAIERARPIAGSLAAELATEPQAYGKVLEGEIALKQGNLPQAIKMLSEAASVLDTWLAHFALGRAYLQAGAYAQADSEFDRCLTRRGEVLMLVDEDPTYGYFPPLYYYAGRAREGLQTAGYADMYREYLKIRGASVEDRLVAEARRRAGQ